MGVLIGLVGSFFRSAFSLQQNINLKSVSKKSWYVIFSVPFGRALLCSHVFPLEDEVPVEATPQVSRGANVVKVIHGNDVNDRTNHIGAILHHTLQHRFLQNMRKSLVQNVI